MQILLINNDGGGFADHVEIDDRVDLHRVVGVELRRGAFGYAHPAAAPDDRRAPPDVIRMAFCEDDLPDGDAAVAFQGLLHHGRLGVPSIFGSH